MKPATYSDLPQSLKYLQTTPTWRKSYRRPNVRTNQSFDVLIDLAFPVEHPSNIDLIVVRL